MNADGEIDPRDRITPNAFRVAPYLIGLPLATPWRRGSAILIDLLLVAILAQTQWLLLAVAPAAASFGWLKKRALKRSQGIGAAILRWTVAIMVFGLITSTMEPIWQQHREEDASTPARSKEDGLDFTGTQGIQFGASIAKLHTCSDAECRRGAVIALTDALAASDSRQTKRLEMADEMVKDAVEDEPERSELLALVQQRLAAAPEPAAPPAPAAPAEASAVAAPKAAAAQKDGDEDEDRKESGGFSLLGLLESLADDLGFSIGWAAVYFSYFPGAWRGQTPGKRLLGLRTVRLNGKPLSYWDSFNRYGGYAAGFATGLIGFLQVFWDANRQAIHDQISFTAVIHDPDGMALERALSAYRAQESS